MGKLSVVINDEDERALRKYAFDNRIKFQPWVRAKVLSLLTPPAEFDELSRTPNRKVLAELVKSIHAIHRMSTAATDALGELAEKLTEGMEVDRENLGDARTREQIEAERREIEGRISSAEEYAGVPGTDDQGDKGDTGADRKKRALRKRA